MQCKLCHNFGVYHNRYCDCKYGLQIIEEEYTRELNGSNDPRTVYKDTLSEDEIDQLEKHYGIKTGQTYFDDDGHIQRSWDWHGDYDY